ncbi:MAG TPA: ankyrin repeat domain-containing protein [Rickettsia endosymbiont of Bembidion nr. Transversale]|nr:ankyrin repeat domain-containing protein [Rickettsia endosymbiont of Bembidion nr. Transversale]
MSKNNYYPYPPTLGKVFLFKRGPEIVSMESSETIQPADKLESILNSTSTITAELLFNTFDIPGISSKTDKLKLLFQKAFEQDINPNIQDSSGNTLLLYACQSSLVEVVQFLLKKGANPNISNNSDNTPLSKIISNRFIDKTEIYIAKLLLQNGALTELKDFVGFTPIQSATQYGHTEIVKSLIQNGADINVIASIETNSYYSGKSLVESVPSNKPELKALLTLTKACKDNDFSIVDNTITAKDIVEFIDWQLSITPENSRFFDKHLSELDNLKNFLETKELVSNETIQKIDEHITSYSTTEISSPDVTPSFINEAEHQEYNLAGETDKFAPETA